MDPRVIAAGASQAGNVASTLLANRANRKMAEWQRDVSLEQWQMENEYNLPSNQVQRLQAAGLNPNLALGAPNGSASFNSVAAPVMQAPQMDPLTMAQVANINADTKKKEAETPDNGKVNSLLQANIEKVNAEIEEVKKRSSLHEREAINQTIESFSKGYKPRGDDMYALRIYADLDRSFNVILKNLQEFEFRGDEIDYLKSAYSYALMGDFANYQLTVEKMLNARAERGNIYLNGKLLMKQGQKLDLESEIINQQRFDNKRRQFIEGDKLALDKYVNDFYLEHPDWYLMDKTLFGLNKGVDDFLKELDLPIPKIGGGIINAVDRFKRR